MHRRSRRPLAPRLVLASSAALLLALTACGSRVDADTMARMNSQGVLVGTDGQPIAAEDGAVPGAVGGAPGSGAVGSGASGGGTTTGGTSGGSGGGPAAGGDAPTGEGATAADGGVEAGSCEGFENSTGITDSEITIANVADISGPVPGLFQAAQDATNAFVTYYNATNSKGNARSISDYLKQAEREGTQALSIYYVDVPAAKVNAESFAAAFEKQGITVVRVQGIATSEFNYAPYAQQMKDDGAKMVQYFGPFQFTIRLQEAMQQQGVDAQFITDPTVYDERYVEQGGDAVDGTLVYSVTQLFDNARIPEMVLYRQWLERTAPGSIPNYYGLFAWSAARLFVQKATELGGKLTRPALVEAVRDVRAWDSNGIHAPMQIGAKETPGCIKFIQLDGGTWKQVSSGDFLCGPVFDSGVGG